MRTAILTDIHANREAFDAVLAATDEVRVDETVLLGDIVGYGPDPAYAVEKVAELVRRGASCVRGNHDEALPASPCSTPTNEPSRWPGCHTTTTKRHKRSRHADCRPGSACGCRSAGSVLFSMVDRHSGEVCEPDLQKWLNVTDVPAMLPAELPSGNIPGVCIWLISFAFSENVTDATIAALLRAR